MLTFGLAVCDPTALVNLDRPVSELKTGTDFQAELDRSLAGTWRDLSVRHVLDRIGMERSLSILLDRRVDPSPDMAIDLGGGTVLGGLQQIAGRLSSEVSVAANTVYIGPLKSTRKLRTLIALRQGELLDTSSNVPRQRVLELRRSEVLHWNDLDSPVGIVEQIANRYGLEVQGRDAIPHDLWSGTTVPSVDAAEALSLVLIQFDLTFAWRAGGSGIEIVPVPSGVSITKSYRPGRVSAQKAIRVSREQLPGLEVKIESGELVARGTVEQLEAFSALVNRGTWPGQGESGRRGNRGAASAPLERRRITLRIQRVPARALLEQLRATNMDIQYDEETLSEAGVDLDERISFSLEKATVSELFDAICKPLGMEYRIDSGAVHLSAE